MPLLEAFAECRHIDLTSTVRFVEYAPRVWQWLRRDLYGTSSEAYVASMAQEGGVRRRGPTIEPKGDSVVRSHGEPNETASCAPQEPA
eukprot:3696492-Prymnesium_polylepis.1